MFLSISGSFTPLQFLLYSVYYTHSCSLLAFNSPENSCSSTGQSLLLLQSIFSQLNLSPWLYPPLLCRRSFIHCPLVSKPLQSIMIHSLQHTPPGSRLSFESLFLILSMAFASRPFLERFLLNSFALQVVLSFHKAISSLSIIWFNSHVHSLPSPRQLVIKGQPSPLSTSTQSSPLHPCRN